MLVPNFEFPWTQIQELTHSSLCRGDWIVFQPLGLALLRSGLDFKMPRIAWKCTLGLDSKPWLLIDRFGWNIGCPLLPSCCNGTGVVRIQRDLYLAPWKVLRFRWKAQAWTYAGRILRFVIFLKQDQRKFNWQMRCCYLECLWSFRVDLISGLQEFFALIKSC